MMGNASAGSIIQQVVPRWAAIKVATPFFWMASLSGDGWQVQYVGGGRFEFVGEASERQLGAIEAYISVAPVVWLMSPPMMIAVFMDDGLVKALALLVSAAPLVVAFRVIGEATVERASPNGESSEGGDSA